MNAAWSPPRLQPMPVHRFDAHTRAHLFRPSPHGATDPVLGVDLFHMPHPTFQPHPHAGMSAVTYLLPESPGGIRNRDSRGDDSLIAPGDLHWTQAGRGMVHEEVPAEPGVEAFGVQVFVNLPAAHREAEPAVFKVAAAEMPVWASAGVTVRVVAGEWLGLASPLAKAPDWWTRLTVLDVTLAAGALGSFNVPSGWNALGLLVSGRLGPASPAEGEAGWQASGPVAIVSGAETPLEMDSPVLLAAGPEGARLVWLMGPARREVTVQWGPFAGNSRAQIQQWAWAHQAGQMGHLEPLGGPAPETQSD